MNNSQRTWTKNGYSHALFTGRSRSREWWLGYVNLPGDWRDLRYKVECPVWTGVSYCEPRAKLEWVDGEMKRVPTGETTFGFDSDLPWTQPDAAEAMRDVEVAGLALLYQLSSWALAGMSPPEDPNMPVF